jgi:hypothetical protein
MISVQSGSALTWKYWKVIQENTCAKYSSEWIKKQYDLHVVFQVCCYMFNLWYSTTLTLPMEVCYYLTKNMNKDRRIKFGILKIMMISYLYL